MSIDEYNDLARKVEQTLQENVPLMQWRVYQADQEGYTTGGVYLCDRWLHFDSTLIVNGKELHFWGSIPAETARTGDVIGVVKTLFATDVTDRVFECRPKQESYGRSSVEMPRKEMYTLTVRLSIEDETKTMELPALVPLEWHSELLTRIRDWIGNHMHEAWSGWLLK